VSPVSWQWLFLTCRMQSQPYPHWETLLYPLAHNVLLHFQLWQMGSSDSWHLEQS
jgi:hypothetical protein